MKCLLRIIPFFIFSLYNGGILSGQEAVMDPATKHLLDSLNNEIKQLNQEIPQLSPSKDISYFYKKRELAMTVFQRDYYTDIFNEEINKAQQLVNTRYAQAQGSYDYTAIKFYDGFKKKVTQARIDQLARYQKLFAKEKNFRKALYKFLDAGDEYSLERAQRMTDLAIKFATQRKLETVLKYLYKYKDLVNAKLYDLHSNYDLTELTKSKKNFQKVFTPLVKSDSLALIKKAGELVEKCYKYAANTQCVLDTSYFALQRNAVLSSISDYNERMGDKQKLSDMGTSALIARRDSLNREGIYKWHDNIVVVGSFIPSSSSKAVQKGEAIINADHRLIRYIRINKLAKLGRVVKIGRTVLIPFTINGTPSNFNFDPKSKRYQYIVCYSKIENDHLTESISKFLPVMQFKSETE